MATKTCREIFVGSAGILAHHRAARRFVTGPVSRIDLRQGRQGAGGYHEIGAAMLAAPAVGLRKETRMHIVMWTFEVMEDKNRNDLLIPMKGAAPKFEGASGLIRKCYGIAEDARSVVETYL